jgi:hypothetical protein
MNITLEQLEARIVELQKQKEITLGDLNAIDGAIQDCQYWRNQLNSEVSSETSVLPVEGEDNEA